MNNELPMCNRGSARIKVDFLLRLDDKKTYAVAEAVFVTVDNDADPKVKTLLAQIISGINKLIMRDVPCANCYEEGK